MRVLLTLAVAAAGGLLARRVRLPGGTLVGAMLATAVASQFVGEIDVPPAVRTALFIGVGVMIGTVVTRDTVRALRVTILPALLSACLLIAAGVAVALALRWLGIAPDGAVLATSPGALSVLTAAALGGGYDATTVALFHITRIFLVMLSLPLLTRLVASAPRGGGGRRSTRDREPEPPDRSDASQAPAEADDGAPPPTPRRRPRDRAATAIQLALTTAGAAAGGLLLAQTGLGGTLVLGATVGAGLVTLASRRPVRYPGAAMTGISVGLGWMVGSLMTPETVAAMPGAVAPAVLAALLLMATGIAISYLLRATGHAPPGDVLATSPGAMEALASAAVARDTGPLEVALFHTVRVLLVILSLPLLLELAA